MDSEIARISALEAHQAALAELLAVTLATMGKLNAHVGLLIAKDAGEAPHARTSEIQAEIMQFYDKLADLWPNLPRRPTPEQAHEAGSL